MCFFVIENRLPFVDAFKINLDDNKIFNYENKILFRNYFTLAV